MAFVRTTRVGTEHTSRGERFRDLPRRPRAVSGLWAHQPEMLKTFTSKANESDLAPERPANTEKTLTNLGFEHVATFPVEVPSADARSALDASPESIWRATVGLREEIAELTRIRDELLSLLMSGRVRVRDTVEVVV